MYTTPFVKNTPIRSGSEATVTCLAARNLEAIDQGHRSWGQLPPLLPAHNLSALKASKVPYTELIAMLIPSLVGRSTILRWEHLVRNMSGLMSSLTKPGDRCQRQNSNAGNFMHPCPTEFLASKIFIKYLQFLFLSTVVSRFSGLGPSPPKCPLNRDSPLNGITV